MTVPVVHHSERAEATYDTPYAAIILNDDKTSFDVVMLILTSVFGKTKEEAEQITMDVHENGHGVAGSPYTKEEAENKCKTAEGVARTFGMPLRVTPQEIK
jgi:ATP-dependent Clp protease adaptor protein ClpS